MKTTLYSLLAAVAAIGFAQAQTAYTTPVGYLTTPIFGNPSGGSAGAGTLMAPTLLRSAEFAAATSAQPSGTSATFSGGVPLGLGVSYMLEITDGASEGWWTTVVSSTATEIIVFDSFPAGLPINTKISVRKFNTIASVFGATNSAAIGASDFIEILDPLTQSTTSVVYVDGWFDLSSEDPADDFVIHPGTAVRVIVNGASSLSLVTTGEVKTTATQVDLFSGEAWVGQTFAANGTFGNLELASKILETDEVLLYGADGGIGQVADSYVASLGAMFNLATEDDAEGVLVPDSSGMIVKRPVGSNTTITFPAQPVGQ